MTSPVTEKATKKNVWQMPESSKYLQRNLVLDNGHLLDQVLKRSGILQREAHKEHHIFHGYHGGNCFGFAMPPSAEVQASLPVSLGGLGFRNAKRHAAVAYLCSRVATRSLCEAMDPSFSWDVAVASGGSISEAIGLCNQHLPADSALDVNTLTVLCASQRALSRRVDEWTKTQLLSSGLANAAERARVQAAGAAHAGAWLTALPSPSLGQRMTHPEFVTAAKVRLGLELLTADTWCPLCDEILDTRASHAMACMSGGDAVRLHNELRDAVFVKCMAAGIQGHREQAELLPDDPRRRPGDVYIPQWPGGQGIAMDFAVTSPLQIALVQAAAERPLAASKGLRGAQIC